MRWRSPSLLWTFAGAFLLVLIAAGVIQWFVTSAALRPIANRLMESRIETLARLVADDLADSLTLNPECDVRAILRDATPEGEPIHLIFRDPSGTVYSSRAFPGDRERSFREFFGPPPDEDRERDTTSRRRRGFERFRALRPLTARVEVLGESGSLGEVVAFAPNARAEFRPAFGPSYLMLFFPVALLVAAIAGLVLFRVLFKRLRNLEELAGRVAAGDLNARVVEPGRDEIGRLGSQLNRMTESLAAARGRVQGMDRQRRQLLADISHELSTPLTSIRGYAETLTRPEMQISDTDRERFLHNILDESERMGLLVNDLLELARLEAGATELTLDRLDWAALCRNVVSRYQDRFKDAGLTITSVEQSTTAWVEADGRKLEQLLENLLINALRYVPSGGSVDVDLQPTSTDETKGFQLIVSDDGPGFPTDDLNHVFDRFYRGDPARSQSGTGLGLAIVKEIAVRHGGSARAENRTPKGARIVVALPVKPGQVPQ